MTTQIHICPQCGCPDLKYGDEGSVILSAQSRAVECPNCGWSGALSDSAAILTTEKVYDLKAVSDILIYTVTKYAGGPLAQTLMLIGLLRRDDQEGLDKILRATLGAMVEAAFTAAAERAKELAEEESK